MPVSLSLPCIAHCHDPLFSPLLCLSCSFMMEYEIHTVLDPHPTLMPRSRPSHTMCMCLLCSFMMEYEIHTVLNPYPTPMPRSPSSLTMCMC